MKILFYTIDMVDGVERLMPWRTVVEIAKYISRSGLYETSICSAQEQGLNQSRRIYEGIRVYQIEYGDRALRHFVDQGGWQVVFYPVCCRMGAKNFSELSRIKAQKIAYVPGGLYPLSGIVALWRVQKVKTVLPYFLERIIPHSILSRKLQVAGFNSIICQSPLTASDAIKSGWPINKVWMSLPGLDNFGDLEPDTTILERLHLYKNRFLLFSGAPAQIRGSQMAIRAFDYIADQLPDFRLVLLMRRDISSDFSEFERLVQSIQHKNQILICYDRLTPQQLKACFSAAYAVLLPFLLIPSEIPLTYFEVMSCGTPVISFRNEGTTDYLHSALKIAPKRNFRDLAQTIVGLCRNPTERNSLANKAQELMSKHPSWNESAKIWIQAIEHSVL